MKIVMGIDDSPHSRAALDWAKQMQWLPGTRFVLVSAVPSEVMPFALRVPGGAFIEPELDDGRIRAHQDLLARAEKEFQAARLDTTALITHGDPREVIVRTAERENADLVIVGSHGRTGVPKLLMGSVASHVVTHAPCTVLVIKRPPEASPRG